MIKYKLISILKTLEPYEWTSLSKYLLMYTRKNSDNFSLFSILRDKITSFSCNEDILVIREKYFSKMSSKSFTNMLSRVTVWTENWIIYQEVKKDEHTTKNILLNYYNNRGLYKEANLIADKAEKKLLSEDGEDLYKYKHLSNIYHSQYYSNNPIKYETGTKLLEKIIQTRLEEYSCQLAFYKVELYNWGEIKNHNFSESIKNINQAVKHIDKNSTYESLALISNVFTSRNSDFLYEIFEKLKAGFYKKESDLELVTVLYLTSLSVRLWNENKLNDSQFMINVHDYSLESGILLSSGKIPSIRWYNILTIIASVSNLKEANNFIDKWIKKVVSLDNNKTKKLSYALVSFYNSDYKNISSILSNISFSSEQEKYRALSLLIIADYKNRHEDYGEFVDSYTKAIRNLKRNKNKITKIRYRQYFNLLTVLYKIAKSEYSNKKIELTLPNPILYKKWLLNEISQVNE